jgi:hypothetical protein
MTHYSLAIYDNYLYPRLQKLKSEGSLPPPNRSELSTKITTTSRSLGDIEAECFGSFVAAIMLHHKHLADKNLPPPFVYLTKHINKGVGLTGNMEKMPDELIQILTIFIDDYNAKPIRIPAEYLSL